MCVTDDSWRWGVLQLAGAPLTYKVGIFEFRMREVPDLEIARIPNARIGGPVEAVCSRL